MSVRGDEPIAATPAEVAAPRDGTEPLAGLRVLDLTDELAALGPRVLVALGADVIRPEPPGGDPLRTRPPLVPRKDGAGEASLAHIHYNAGKRSVPIPATGEGRPALDSLAGQSDVVIASEGSPYFGLLIESPEALVKAHPDCSLVVVRHFPHDSELRDWEMTDLILSASSGFAWFCGEPGDTPEHPKGQLAYSYVGATSAMAAMAAVVSREREGRSDWFDIAAQEAFAFATCQSADPNQYRWHNNLPGRAQWVATAQRALHQCGDGNWCTFVMQGPHFEELAQWFSEAGVGDDFLSEDWLDREYFKENLPRIIEAIGKLCMLYDRDEVVTRGQALGLMVMPVHYPLDVLADPQLRHRGMFVETPTLVGDLSLPRVPVVSSTPPGAALDWGAPGETQATQPDRDRDDSDIACLARKGTAIGRPLPLEGVRVADFGWMLAGPLATRFLADLGAEVIRIESHARRDAVREIGPQPPDMFSLDTNSTYHQSGCNKRSIALNLKHPDALAIAQEIIASSDIVFDNYAPGTMKKLGLDPETLLQTWPHLLVVSQPAVGATGPHSHWGAIGNGVAGYAGLNGISGFPDKPPFGLGPIVADQVAPLFTVTALLTALRERDRTGIGRHIDCSMLEANTWALDTALLEAQIRGENPERSGNRSSWMAPHGIFPCEGNDEWIAIAVRTDSEWEAAARVLGLEGLAADPRFATLASRKANEGELEEAVRKATCSSDRWTLATALQTAGVPASPVMHLGDHFGRDAGMRDCFTSVSHPYGYEFLVRDQFVRPRGNVVANHRAPMLGEDSADILREVLGKDDAEIAELTASGVLH